MEALVRLLPGLAAMLSAMLGGLVLLPRNRSRQHVFWGLLNLGTFLWSASVFFGLTLESWAAAAGISDYAAFSRWLFTSGQVGVAIATTYFFCFAAETVGRHALTRDTALVLVHVPGALMVFAVITNPVHNWFARWGSASATSAFTYGGLAWVLIAMAYGLVVSGILLYLIAWREALDEPLRPPYAMLAIAGTLPLVANLVWLTRGFTGFEFPYNPTLVMFAVMNLMMGLAISRAGLLDMVPTAEGQAFHSMADAGVVVGRDGRVIAMNPQARHVLPDLTVGRSILEGAPELGMRASSLAEETGCEDFELWKSGRTYWVRCVPMQLRRGRALGRLLLLTDVSDKRAAAKQIMRLNEELEQTVVELQAAMSARTRFVGNISHELRTPLQAIIGYAGLVSRGVAGPVTYDQHEHLEVVLDAARHLLAVIDSLLELSSSEAEELAVHPAPFDLHEAAERVVRTLRQQAARKGIELFLEPAKGSCRMISDETRIREILINLVGNAIKFTAAGEVVLELTPDERHGEVVIRVVDTGPGIPPEQAEHIFEPFYQVYEPGAHKPPGVGLGLYLTGVLVQLLGGSIVADTVPGKGASFTVTLPLALTEDTARSLRESRMRDSVPSTSDDA